MLHGFFLPTFIVGGLLAWGWPGPASGAEGRPPLQLARQLAGLPLPPGVLPERTVQPAAPPPPVVWPALVLRVDGRLAMFGTPLDPPSPAGLPPAVGQPPAPPPAAVAVPAPVQPPASAPPVTGEAPAGGLDGVVMILLAGLGLLLAGWAGVRYGRSRQPDHPSKPDKLPSVKCEFACLPANLVALVGRQAPMRQLDLYLADPGVAVVNCVAAAGVGKSALMEGWLNAIEPHFGGTKKVFAWTFQGVSIAHARSVGSGPGSSGLFFARALRFFGHEGPLPESEEKRATLLSRLLYAQPSLLILDGVEPLQYPDEVPVEQLADSFIDPGLYHLLRRLCHPPVGQSLEGSLVVLTSRRFVGGGLSDLVSLGSWQEARGPCRELVLDTLTEREGVQLLQAMGVDKPWTSRLPVMVRAVHGHALTLILLGGLLTQQRPEWQPTPGAIEQWLAPGEFGEHWQRLLRHYDRQVWPKESVHGLFLRLFGLLDRPMREEEWQAIRAGAALAQPLQEMNLVASATLVDDLERAGFLLPYSTRCGWQLHPLVRDYFAQDLEEEYGAWIAEVDDAPPDWQNPLRQAHGVLFQYFQAVVDKEQPDGLAALEPLYRAVQHGCRAGQYKQALHGVFVRRIRRGADYFSLARLGAYSSDLTALAGFFPNGWRSSPVTGDLSEEDRIWLLAEAAFCLTASGRVEEALGPQEAGWRLEQQRGAPQGGARAAAALCDLQMATGRLRVALETARQGGVWAERHGLPVLHWVLQTRRAMILHRLGEWSDSLAAFQETEAVPIQISEEFLQFMAMADKAHIELLLEQRTVPLEELLGRAERIEQQARAGQQPLCLILGLLSRGRVLAAMGQNIEALLALQEAARQAEERDGETPLLAEILCQRAVLLHRQGEFQAARTELTRTVEIACRWGLPLLEVDGRLLEAEWLLDEQRYASAEERLARAEALIEQTEYGQRREAALALRSRCATDRDE
ncbi:MAG: tetratricopeptide repeat protein [Magnetococcus sp. DMHC-8]